METYETRINAPQLHKIIMQFDGYKLLKMDEVT